MGDNDVDGMYNKEQTWKRRFEQNWNRRDIVRVAMSHLPKHVKVQLDRPLSAEQLEGRQDLRLLAYLRRKKHESKQTA